jgi:hypothetical protein
LFPCLRISGSRLEDWAVLNINNDFPFSMALTHHPAVVYNSLENARWVRTAGHRLLDTAEDRNLAVEVAQLMAEYRQKYSWQAVSVENICIPEIGMPFSMIQIGPEENPCGPNGITFVNPVIIDDYQGQDIHAVLGSCGSLRDPSFFFLRPRQITIRGITLEDYLSGSSMLTTIYPYGNYYPNLYQHEIEHTFGICLSDKGPIANLYTPHGRFQIPRKKGHFPSEFGSFINSIFHDAINLSSDSPLTFAVKGDYIRYKWEADSVQTAIPGFPAELQLVLDFEQGKPYYQLHEAGCRKIPSRLDYGRPFRFILPNYPGVADILRKNYVDYQKTSPQEPFFRPELRACTCMNQ